MERQGGGFLVLLDGEEVARWYVTDDLDPHGATRWGYFRSAARPRVQPEFRGMHPAGIGQSWESAP